MPDLQYTDPRLASIYDLGNAGTQDRDFYLNLAGAPPQTVLDLGCGTGLITDRLAALGHHVTGVDPALAMLDVARAKPNGERIEWVHAGAEDFVSANHYDLIIMTGHAFQVLLSDAQIAGVLKVMSDHLQPDGLAVFESRNPALDWDAIWARSYKMQTAYGLVTARRRTTSSARAPEFLSFAWDYDFPDGPVTSKSTLRFPTYEQVREFAEDAGLYQTALLGDWDGTVFDESTSREMIFKFKRKM
ncbi:MAG: methyltransferase domain-containing protein [Pseudomonadota bacterium]